MGDRITGQDEAYSVTACAGAGPMARSVVNLLPVQGEAKGPLCNGQEIRIVANPHIANKGLYLHSQPVSPMVFARFSRNQEVCLVTKPNYNTVWTIAPGNAAAKTKYGQQVRAGDPIILQHSATVQYLSTDKIAYNKEFGNEMEVSAMCASTKAKTQMLAGEYNGDKVREDVVKNVANTNIWTIELSAEPSGAEPVVEAPKYEGAQMMQDIKDTLKKRGVMMIRGIGRVFRILDDNRNRQIERNELLWGLKDFDIHLSEEQVDVLMKHFDRDGSGTVNFDEFLVALRGDLNEDRLQYIKAAYDKLDVTRSHIMMKQ